MLASREDSLSLTPTLIKCKKLSEVGRNVSTLANSRLRFYIISDIVCYFYKKLLRMLTSREDSLNLTYLHLQTRDYGSMCISDNCILAFTIV